MSNSKYDHKSIEKKWQKKWADERLYETKEDPAKPKYYILDMFPYPSGAGLHVGHPKGYIATDIFARMKAMQGYNVLHPMGWDAFGLPAENYALKNKEHPRISTENNVATYKRQLEMLGFSYDWDREINTTDPEFYKWTQWTFLQMFKRGIAFESHEPIIWCPSCMTGLAMEDLEDGKCERCGSEIERKPMRQWVLRMTDYAQRMLDDLDKLPHWEESIKEMQRNWIGRSEGAIVKFQIKNDKFQINSKIQISNEQNAEIEIFTTRPDTLFGATYFVVAPEHPMIGNWKLEIGNWNEVEKYIKKAGAKSDMERTELNKEKTGVRLEGLYAVNPVNGEKLPIFAADYVMMGYGTGAIMAVPAHDERDFEFAKKYGLRIKEVVDTKKDNVIGTCAIIKSKSGKFIFQRRDNNTDRNPGMIAPFGGGIEKNETSSQALIREMKEELNLDVEGRFTLVNKIESHNFPGKFLDIFYFEQIDTDSLELGEGEAIVELSIEEALNMEDVTPFTKKVLKNFGLNKCFAENGVAVNSEFLNGFETSEAKEKMIQWLEENKLGRKKVNFKLRDWVFSRQRYWGEPIPIIHCEHCRERIEKSARAINFYEQSIWERLVRGIKTVETRALNPEEPERYFGDIKSGDYLKGVNKVNGQEQYFKVVNAKIFKNLTEFHQDKEMVAKTFAPIEAPDAVEDLEKLYDFTEDYVARINQNGLVAWEVELAFPGVIAVPDKDLPMRLPEVEHYEPSGTGESPLATIADWVNTNCPECGGGAKRETNTMPQWAGSSWYYLAFVMRGISNFQFPISKYKEAFERWIPVDFYVGGAEHATRHLIYARFWHKFLYDIGAVNCEEPFTRLQHVGLIMAEDGRKMSKRWGNVINPDDIVERYGADAMRVYEMFMGPFSQAVAWSTNGLIGARKFLERISNLQLRITNEDFRINADLSRLLHKTIKKVGDDIEEFKLNTAVSAMMILLNAMEKENAIARDVYEKFLIILAPFAPHLVEEIWESLGHSESIFMQSWPKHDPDLARDERIRLVVQVNGKLRDTVELDAEISEEDAKKIALESEKVKKYIEGKEILKAIYVKGKLVNVVVG